MVTYHYVKSYVSIIIYLEVNVWRFVVFVPFLIIIIIIILLSFFPRTMNLSTADFRNYRG
jgi:hypothetical protein